MSVVLDSAMLQEANLDHSFITTFCEFLLFRPASQGETGLSPTQWRNEKQMVFKYVQLSCSHIAKQQALADSRMLQVGHLCLCFTGCNLIGSGFKLHI